jgi:cell division protein FtsB
VDREDHRNKISFRMLFTLFLVFFVAISSALYYAVILDIQTRTANARRQANEQRETNAALRAEITQRYSLDEVERIAVDRLGMAKPDISQVVRINVPKQSYVVLNDEDMPAENEDNLLDGLSTFIGNFIRDLQGGSHVE